MLSSLGRVLYSEWVSTAPDGGADKDGGCRVKLYFVIKLVLRDCVTILKILKRAIVDARRWMKVVKVYIFLIAESGCCIF
jgi:hypothetical protein